MTVQNSLELISIEIRSELFAAKARKPLIHQ